MSPQLSVAALSRKRRLCSKAAYLPQPVHTWLLVRMSQLGDVAGPVGVVHSLEAHLRDGVGAPSARRGVLVSDSAVQFNYPHVDSVRLEQTPGSLDALRVAYTSALVQTPQGVAFAVNDTTIHVMVVSRRKHPASSVQQHLPTFVTGNQHTHTRTKDENTRTTDGTRARQRSRTAPCFSPGWSPRRAYSAAIARTPA